MKTAEMNLELGVLFPLGPNLLIGNALARETPFRLRVPNP